MAITEQDGVDLVAAAQKTAEESELTSAILTDILEALKAQNTLFQQLMLNMASSGLVMNRVLTTVTGILTVLDEDAAQIVAETIIATEGSLPDELAAALAKFQGG